MEIRCSIGMATEKRSPQEKGSTYRIKSYPHRVNENLEIGCQCSLTNSCDSRYNDDNICNCDDRDTNSDVGVLSSRDQLPVTQLAYGDSDHRYSFIHYELGDLVCYGKRGLYPSEAAETDFMFKASFTGGLV